MALTKLNSASVIDRLPVGSVIQTVSFSHNTAVTVGNTTFTDTNANSLAITPTYSSSKICVMINQVLHVWNSSHYATGRWRVQRNIGGGSYSSVYEDNSSTNGQIFAYDYGGSGINVMKPTQIVFLDTPNTTSQVIYKTQIALASNGGASMIADSNCGGRTVIQEIKG